MHFCHLQQPHRVCNPQDWTFSLSSRFPSRFELTYTIIPFFTHTSYVWLLYAIEIYTFVTVIEQFNPNLFLSLVVFFFFFTATNGVRNTCNSRILYTSANRASLLDDHPPLLSNEIGNYVIEPSPYARTKKEISRMSLYYEFRIGDTNGFL